jgi:hypothetical protein
MSVYQKFLVVATRHEIATRSSSKAKKPVVLASNRGPSFLKTLKLVEWCLSMMPLEPSFKDNLLLEATGVEP